MRRHQLMMRNIHQQILLLERLDNRREHDGDDFERGGRDGGLRDEDAGVEFVLGDVVGEGAHLLDADAGVGGEFDPDGADLGLGEGSALVGMAVYLATMGSVGRKEVFIFLRLGGGLVWCSFAPCDEAWGRRGGETDSGPLMGSL